MAEDILYEVVYTALASDSEITELVGNRIKFYEYPDTGDVSGPYIIIDPLDVPNPEEYADDTWLSYDYIYQVDIWSKDRHDTANVSELVLFALWRAGFRPYGGNDDEWDKDTGIFRHARRFRGRIYREDII